MKKAVILFRSRKGTTNAFAREIGIFFRDKRIDTIVKSIDDYTPEMLKDADIVMLGCWTQGMFLLFQHPDRYWKDFVKKLPDLNDKKIGLFTTYKIYTGSMFSAMKKHLNGKINNMPLEIKSRNDKITAQNKISLEDFISS